MLLVDADAGHVAAVRRDGLVLRGAGGERSVAVPAATPGEVDGPLHRVLLCVKAQATADAAGWIGPRLAEDGYVVSVQDGLNEGLIATSVGLERVIGAFAGIVADVVEPGVIRDGGPGRSSSASWAAGRAPAWTGWPPTSPRSAPGPPATSAATCGPSSASAPC